MLPSSVHRRRTGAAMLLLVLLWPVSAAIAEPVPCQLARVFAGNGQYGDAFGSAVAVEGGWALFGVEGDNPAGDNSGSVRVYRQSPAGEWLIETILAPADGVAGDRFGCAVALDGQRLIVGARGDDDSGNGSGSAYIFRYNGTEWAEEAMLQAADGASWTLYDDTAFCGAVDDDDNGENSGSVYDLSN